MSVLTSKRFWISVIVMVTTVLSLPVTDAYMNDLAQAIVVVAQALLGVGLVVSYAIRNHTKGSDGSGQGN